MVNLERPEETTWLCTVRFARVGDFAWKVQRDPTYQSVEHDSHREYRTPQIEEVARAGDQVTVVVVRGLTDEDEFNVPSTLQGDAYARCCNALKQQFPRTTIVNEV